MPDKYILEEILSKLGVSQRVRLAILIVCVVGTVCGGLAWRAAAAMVDEHNSKRYYSIADHTADEANRKEIIAKAVKLNDEKFSDLGKKIEIISAAQATSISEQKEMHGQFTEVRDSVRSISTMLINKSASAKLPPTEPLTTNR